MLLLILNCGVYPSNTPSIDIPYSFNQANRIIELPNELVEISGITLSKDEQHFFAVQDEQGIVFKIDRTRGTIISNFRFEKDGDYEDITQTNEHLFVLKSNRTIYQISAPATPQQSVKKFSPQHLTSAADTEGLTWDSLNNRLLIACKNATNRPEERAIYAFDLNTQQFLATPIFKIQAKVVYDFLHTHPTLKKWNQLIQLFDPNAFSFSPSGIAIHPHSKDIFILSAVGNAIVILSESGDIKHVEKLDKSLYHQPEGICFTKDGTLYIANEGSESKKGNIIEVLARA
jgi:uncharacterized protein YjiK